MATLMFYLAILVIISGVIILLTIDDSEEVTGILLFIAYGLLLLFLFISTFIRNIWCMERTGIESVTLLPMQDSCYLKDGKILVQDIGYIKPDSIFIDANIITTHPAIYKQVKYETPPSLIFIETSRVDDILYINSKYVCSDIKLTLEEENK